MTGMDLEQRGIVFGDAGPDLGTTRSSTRLGSNIDMASVPGVRPPTRRPHRAGRGEWVAVLRQIADKSGRVVVCGGGLTGIETAAELAESFPALEVELVSRGGPGAWLSGQSARAIWAGLSGARGCGCCGRHGSG